jgi:hypothetical protein
MVIKGDKNDADTVRLFKVHLATVSGLQARPKFEKGQLRQIACKNLRQIICKVTHFPVLLSARIDIT